MSRPSSREKSDFSQKVIELRSLFGESQQAFANRLGVALNTVARWETGSPPSAEMLLALARVADQHGAVVPRDLFREKYLEQMEDPGFELLMMPETETRPAYGLLTKRLSGRAQLLAALNWLDVLKTISSSDKTASKKAADALKALARECNANAQVDDIKDSLIEGIGRRHK